MEYSICNVEESDSKNGTVKIPNHVINIEGFAFSHLQGLKYIKIPANIKNIDNCAFLYCSNLETIVLESADTEIENGAFKGCDNLKEIKVPNGDLQTIWKQYGKIEKPVSCKISLCKQKQKMGVNYIK